mgnify:FL=1
MALGVLKNVDDIYKTEVGNLIRKIERKIALYINLISSKCAIKDKVLDSLVTGMSRNPNVELGGTSYNYSPLGPSIEQGILSGFIHCKILKFVSEASDPHLYF